MRIALMLMWLNGPVTAAEPASQEADKPSAQGEWDRLLRAHVSGGRVDYGGFSRERAALDRYLSWVADKARKPDMAFYLNAYNATVVKSVLEHGRPKRVTDVKGFFEKEKHVIAGRSLTLNGLENTVRKRYGDPRIHFALNCAAKSCPRLWGRAFSAKTLDRTLDKLTREFLDGPGVRVDAKAKTVAVSKLFEWYREDFVEKEGSIKKYLARWVSEAGRRKALEAGHRIVFQEYDWALNGK